MPQSQAAAHHRHQEEEETEKKSQKSANRTNVRKELALSSPNIQDSNFLSVHHNCSRRYLFSEKTNLDISTDLSAWQTIHMKCQDLYTLKKKRAIRMASATYFLGAFIVNLVRHLQFHIDKLEHYLIRQ